MRYPKKERNIERKKAKRKRLTKLETSKETKTKRKIEGKEKLFLYNKWVSIMAFNHLWIYSMLIKVKL